MKDKIKEFYELRIEQLEARIKLKDKQDEERLEDLKLRSKETDKELRKLI